ncbi:MAG: superoxide dismutase family protein [Acidobacteriota bacterium]
MKIGKNFSMIGLIILLLTVSSCRRSEPMTDNEAPKGDQAAQNRSIQTINKAIAVLTPTPGNQVRGIVTFTKTGDKVRMVAELEGLPAGAHGFHIHEYGDCSAADANSAGNHFNPAGKPHSAPTAEQRHLGDLGNIQADASGHARLEWNDPVIKLEGPNSIIGRSVVVHAKADDLKSQPSGEAGARVACGAIGVAK